MIILSIEKVPTTHEANVKIIFDQILLLYGLFIDPTNTLFSLTEWKMIVDHQGDLLTRLIKTFLQLNEEFLERIKHSDQQQRHFYDCLFNYWYKIVKSLIDVEYAHPILDIYHRYLTHVPWNDYCLTIESILILDQLISANNHEKNSSFSLYEFILHLVSSINIHQFVLNDDEHSLVSLVPIYFRLLINIFISSQVKFTQVNFIRSKENFKDFLFIVSFRTLMHWVDWAISRNQFLGNILTVKLIRTLLKELYRNWIKISLCHHVHRSMVI